MTPWAWLFLMAEVQFCQALFEPRTNPQMMRIHSTEAKKLVQEKNNGDRILGESLTVEIQKVGQNEDRQFWNSVYAAQGSFSLTQYPTGAPTSTYLQQTGSPTSVYQIQFPTYAVGGPVATASPTSI